MNSEDALDNVWVQMGIGLSIITAISYYLFFYTTLLGPYGDPQDVYHLLILIAALFMALLLTQIWRKVEDI